MKKTLILSALACILFTANAQVINSDSIRYNQYGKAVGRMPLSAENRDGVLVFESKNQDYKFWFDIRVQADGQIFTKDTMNTIGNGVTIRRARFATKVQVTKNWYGELDLNFANGSLALEDAIIEYNFLNGLRSRVGNFKEEFSMAENASSRYLNFMERPTIVELFAPSRHLGWETVYSGKKFLAIGGIFFQEVSDDATSTNVQDNNKDYGRNQGYSLDGRFIYQPFGENKDHGLHLAFAYSYRTPKTDVAETQYGMAEYSARALSYINRKKYMDTGLIPNIDHEQLTNIEIAGFYKGWLFQSEFIHDRTFRTSSLGTLDFGGFYVQGTCMLFGGRQVYEKEFGDFTQPDTGKKWGDVELALRYDYANLNNKDIYGGSCEGYTAGLNFYTCKNVKFQLNYSYINQDRYANGKGKLFVGHDATGALTKDPTKVVEPKGKGGDDFGMIGLRCEIDY